MKNFDITYDNQWTGYKNYRDITNLASTDIIAGSKNIIIDDGAKASVRGGSRFLGSEGTIGVQTNPYWTIAHRIHSAYSKFTNGGGNTVPLRIYYSGQTSIGDVFQAYLPEYLAGVEQSTKKWYTASETISPATPLISKHKYYFAEWWDNIGFQPWLIFVSGNNKINSWNVGYAPITAVGGTSITTTQPLSALGFLNATQGGSNTIIINGKAYITDGDFTGTTTNIPAGTTGISVNNLAFSKILTYTYPDTYAFDVCGTAYNQVFYKDWKQRTVLVSWQYNQNASLGLTIYQGTSGLNDGVYTGTHTGNQTNDFVVSIDSVSPEEESQAFQGVGLNDITFNTSGYTGGNGENKYKVTIVAGGGFTFGATPTFIPNEGDILIGGTSGAIAKVIHLDAGGEDPAVEYLNNATFISGETITGTQGSYGTVFSVTTNNWFKLYKNNVEIVPTSPVYTPFWAYQLPNAVNTISFVDGLSFSFGSYGAHTVGDTWELVINSGGADTFSWSLNGENQGDNIAITGSAQSLSDGISITFQQTTGHKQGDSWFVRAKPKVEHGYRRFTFTQPDRIKGEGEVITLDSNGWTLIPQEDAMYLNASGGEYYQVTELDDGLNVQRLKTEPQFKTLYPYLIGHMENYIVTIVQDKSFNVLGRQEFLELPQMRTLSDDVKFLFETANWENGNIMYGKTKTFFTLPEEGIVIIYDNFMKYFHSPMEFPRRVSSIEIIDNKVCGHSYERNETYELFTEELNDLGQYAIESKIVKPYTDEGNRFDQKSMNAIAIDGYMTGNPDLRWRVNAGVGGCDGSPNGVVIPQICIPTDTASLGKSSLGYHGLGNSPTDVIPHFKFGRTFPPTKYYLRNIEIECDSLEQRWSIVSLGLHVTKDEINNSNLFNIIK